MNLDKALYWLKRVTVLAPVVLAIALANVTDWRFALGAGLLLAWARDVWIEAQT
jgi:hypothetical protein